MPILEKIQVTLKRGTAKVYLKFLLVSLMVTPSLGAITVTPSLGSHPDDSSGSQTDDSLGSHPDEREWAEEMGRSCAKILKDASLELVGFLYQILTCDARLANENAIYFLLGTSLPEYKKMFKTGKYAFKRFVKGNSTAKVLASYVVSEAVKASIKMAEVESYVKPYLIPAHNGKDHDWHDIDFAVSLIVTSILWQLADSVCKEVGGGETLKAGLKTLFDGTGVTVAIDKIDDFCGSIMQDVLDCTKKCTKTCLTAVSSMGTALSNCLMPEEVRGSPPGVKTKLQAALRAGNKAYLFKQMKHSHRRRRLVNRLEFEALRSAAA